MNLGDFVTFAKEFTGKKGFTPAQVKSFVNMAKLSLQQRHNFAFTRTEATLSYPSSTGTGVALPSDFKSFYHDHAVRVVTGGLDYPLEASSEMRELRRLFSSSVPSFDNETGVLVATTTRTSKDATPPRYYTIPGPFTAGAQTHKLRTLPEQLSQSLQVTYYAWLPDYSADADQDFLLARGYDLLLWETLKIANTFIFQESKLPINVDAAQAAFDRFERLDNELDGSAGPIDID